MRKFIILLVAAILMTGFTACQKEKEGDLPNKLYIGKKSYTMAAACCYSYEYQNINKYNLFFTHRLNWNKNGDWVSYNDAYANGFEVNLHYLHAQGTSLDMLPDGEYTFDNDAGSFTHSGESDYMFYDKNGKPGRWIDMGQSYVGKSKLIIEIKHISDKTYEIKFTGATDYDGNAVSGYYKGEVDFYRPR